MSHDSIDRLFSSLLLLEPDLEWLMGEVQRLRCCLGWAAFLGRKADYAKAFARLDTLEAATLGLLEELPAAERLLAEREAGGG